MTLGKREAIAAKVFVINLNAQKKTEEERSAAKSGKKGDRGPM